MLKKVLIGAIIFFIIAIVGAWYMLFYRKNTPDNSSTTTQDKNYFPFGTGGTKKPPATTTPQDINDLPPNDVTEQPAGPQTLADFALLSRDPVSGSTTFLSGSTTLVRFIKKADGHISEVNLNAATTSVISNTTIPRISESTFLNKGNSIILRYIGDSSIIQTYSSVLIKSPTTTPADAPYALRGSFFPENITSFGSSPDQKQIFYIESHDQKSNGSIAAIDGSKTTLIYSSAFGDWNIQWPEQNTLALTTKASGGIAGYLYFMPIKSGILQKIIGPVFGLVTKTNPQKTYVLLSDDNLRLASLNIKTNEVKDTGLSTIAEKCTWSTKVSTIAYCAIPIIQPTGPFPDSWYMGVSTFTDDIYKINVADNTNELVAHLSGTYGRDIDAIDLKLTPNEDRLIMTNKKNYSLWALKLNF